MALRAMLIGQEELDALCALRERAAANPISLSEMQERAAAHVEGRFNPDLHNRDFIVHIPVGFQVVFTIEHHPPGPCRHMSISVSGRGNAPNLFSVELVLSTLGYINQLQNCIVYPETAPDGTFAINVIEPLDGNVSKMFKKEMRDAV